VNSADLVYTAWAKIADTTTAEVMVQMAGICGDVIVSGRPVVKLLEVSGKDGDAMLAMICAAAGVTFVATAEKRGASA
jgi:hypothetical protein